MKIKAAQFRIEVSLDAEDDMKPDIGVEVHIEGGFEFLNTDRGILAAWLRAAANSLDPEVDTPDTVERG